MRKTRFILFGISILAGLIAGSLLGWYIGKVKPQEIKLDTLRNDYKADYALMVAEIYQQEQDILLAISRLEYLGSEDTLDTMTLAYETARGLGYNREDLEIMAALKIKLEEYYMREEVKP